MKLVKLYTAEDNKSYFKDIDIILEKDHPLGRYSENFPVSGINFREFEKGNELTWHNAPQEQYIIYLEGQVEVEASGGDRRVFIPGDILFATDLTGAGHITRTLTAGKSVIITTQLPKE